MQEVRDESETFLAFAREYYPLLRELYNVAGAEMAEQYIDFKRLGRGAYNDKHSKAYPNFRKLLKEY